jgi:hypothetical protein
VKGYETQSKRGDEGEEQGRRIRLLGRQALIGERRSAQLLPRALDLHDRLAERYPKEPLVSEYKEILRAEHKAAPPATA